MSKLNYKSKMQFVESLNLLGDQDPRFLWAINELRNTVIHDVRNVGFDLKVYVAGFDTNRLQQEAKRFNSFSEDDNEIDMPGEGKVPIQVLFKAIPKRSIWWSAMFPLRIQTRARPAVSGESNRASEANGKLRARTGQ